MHCISNLLHLFHYTDLMLAIMQQSACSSRDAKTYEVCSILVARAFEELNSDDKASKPLHGWVILRISLSQKFISCLNRMHSRKRRRDAKFRHAIWRAFLEDMTLLFDNRYIRRDFQSIARSQKRQSTIREYPHKSCVRKLHQSARVCHFHIVRYS